MDGYFSENEINDDKSPEEEDRILTNDEVVNQFYEIFLNITIHKIGINFTLSDIG